MKFTPTAVAILSVIATVTIARLHTKKTHHEHDLETHSLSLVGADCKTFGRMPTSTRASACNDCIGASATYQIGKSKSCTFNPSLMQCGMKKPERTLALLWYDNTATCQAYPNHPCDTQDPSAAIEGIARTIATGVTPLNDPLGLTLAYIEKVEGEHSFENLHFLISYYGNIASKVAVEKVHVESICNQFINPKSTSQINIESAILDSLSLGVCNPASACSTTAAGPSVGTCAVGTAFDAAIDQIKILSRDTFRRFKEESAFCKLGYHVPQ